MYKIAMTFTATALIWFAIGETDTHGLAPIWLAMIIFGGAVLGHVITEALNEEE